MVAKIMKSLLLALLVVTFIGLSCQRRTCPPRKPDLVCPIQFNFKDFVCTDTIRVYKSKNCVDCSEYCKVGFNDDCFERLVNYIKENTKEQTEPIWIFFISKGYASEIKKFDVNDVLALGHYYYIPESKELILKIFLRDTLSGNYYEIKELSGNVSGLNTMNSTLIADDFYSEIPKKSVINIGRYLKSTGSSKIDVSLKFKNDKFFERFTNFMKKYKK
jgi:hypothetical protein